MVPPSDSFRHSQREEKPTFAIPDDKDDALGLSSQASSDDEGSNKADIKPTTFCSGPGDLNNTGGSQRKKESPGRATKTSTNRRKDTKCGTVSPINEKSFSSSLKREGEDEDPDVGRHMKDTFGFTTSFQLKRKRNPRGYGSSQTGFDAAVHGRSLKKGSSSPAKLKKDPIGTLSY